MKIALAVSLGFAVGVVVGHLTTIVVAVAGLGGALDEDWEDDTTTTYEQPFLLHWETFQ